MNSKILSIIAISIILAMSQSCIAAPIGLPSTQYVDQSLYTDSILWVYNSTCIETQNYQYVLLANQTLDLTELDQYDNLDIFVQPIKELGPKSLSANIILP